MQPGEWGAKLTEIRFHKEKTKRILKLKKEVWKAWTFVGMFFQLPFQFLIPLGSCLAATGCKITHWILQVCPAQAAVCSLWTLDRGLVVSEVILAYYLTPN